MCYLSNSIFQCFREDGTTLNDKLIGICRKTFWIHLNFLDCSISQSPYLINRNWDKLNHFDKKKDEAMVHSLRLSNRHKNLPFLWIDWIQSRICSINISTRKTHTLLYKHCAKNSPNKAISAEASLAWTAVNGSGAGRSSAPGIP